MIVEILVQRRGDGVLTARVLQEGQAGRNLLRGRALTKVESAQAAATAALFAKLKYRVELEIVWKLKV